MNVQPPIAKGIISMFDEILKDIHRLSFINRMYETDKELPPEYKGLQCYGDITENSTEEDCFKLLKTLRDLPLMEEYAAKSEDETSIGEFYQNFRRFRDLIQQKIALPLQPWKERKLDLMNFSDVYEKLEQELEDTRHFVEKAKFLRNKEVSDKKEKAQCEKKIDSAAEDLKSLQPFFIIANSEEHIEKFSALKEKKLQTSQDQLKTAEQNFQQAMKTNKEEIQTIIEETIQTKSFMEWIEEKNYIKSNDLEVKVKEMWAQFSREMEKSRNLAKIYSEKHAFYLDIKRQEDYEERLGKQEAAAILLQAHWRGYITRRRLRGDSLFEF